MKKSIPDIHHHIYVFVVSVLEHLDQIEIFQSVLDPEEKRRSKKFYFEADRHRFIISHGILRFILGYYIGQRPELIHYEYNIHGKPSVLIENQSKLRFNLSHSKDYILIAVSDDVLGVDIEFMNPKIEIWDIVDRFFSLQERQEYGMLPEEQKFLGFYQAWTRKEAYIKTIGRGLMYSLNKFSVTLSPNVPASIYDIQVDDENRKALMKGEWFLYSFMPNKDYCAAIAWKGKPHQIVFVDFQSLKKRFGSEASF